MYTNKLFSYVTYCINLHFGPSKQNPQR